MKTKRGQLYINLDTGIIIQCTKDGDGSNMRGRVVISGTEHYKIGHQCDYWNSYALVPYEPRQEPELNVIL
jgi:hypothetical protein